MAGWPMSGRARHGQPPPGALITLASVRGNSKSSPLAQDLLVIPSPGHRTEPCSPGAGGLAGAEGGLAHPTRSPPPL